jgi:hypothetical protein
LGEIFFIAKLAPGKVPGKDFLEFRKGFYLPCAYLTSQSEAPLQQHAQQGKGSDLFFSGHNIPPPAICKT